MRPFTIGVASVSCKICDFEGNKKNIQNAIFTAEQEGADLLVLPELATTGYSLGDRILWDNIVEESSKVISSLVISSPKLMVFVGCPAMARSNIFNGLACLTKRGCRGVTLKRNLPTYGVFYEGRNYTEGSLYSPSLWNKSVYGNNIYRTMKTCISAEICEDLWANDTIISEYCHNGAEIMVNGSASPYGPGKDEMRRSLLSAASMKNICVYAYANHIGLEDRLVFGGECYIYCNGTPVPFDIVDGELYGDGPGRFYSATIDLDDISRERMQNTTWRRNAVNRRTDISLEYIEVSEVKHESNMNPIKSDYEMPDPNEILSHLAMGLADYYRKNGFFETIVVALSGGRDSALCLYIAVMAAKLLGKEPSELVHSFYLRHSGNSTDRTETLARELAAELDVKFSVHDITDLCDSFENKMRTASPETDLGRITKQNIQARVRGAFTLNYANDHKSLVLVTSNLSESAVGYCTTGGDNQGGLSLISNIPKTMVDHILKSIGSEAIEQIRALPPSAELEPGQKDETDLMPYEILDFLLYNFVMKHRPIVDCYRYLQEKFPHLTDQHMKNYCMKFLKLICSNQWKRDQHPIGIRVLNMDLDPKSGFRFPVIQSVQKEIEELEGLDAE